MVEVHRMASTCEKLGDVALFVFTKTNIYKDVWQYS